MLQFWIVRAGITQFEREGRILGTLDVPLHRDAAQKIDHVIRESSSPRSSDSGRNTPKRFARQRGKCSAHAEIE